MRKAETEGRTVSKYILQHITSLSFVFFLPFWFNFNHLSYFSLFLKLAKLILAPKTLYMFSTLYQVHVFYLLVIFQVSTDYHFIITSLTNGQYSYMILLSYFIANIMTAFKLFINSNNLFNVIIIAIMTASW